MGLLAALTVVYAIVLVVAIAASVITIGVALARTARSLDRIAAGLVVVEHQTQPLGAAVDALNAGLGEVATRLGAAADHLATADDELAAALGEPTLRQPASNVA